jgi:catechol 2,3-dioxygenase-like lactoylglutathione lyase family enzyme
MTFGADRGPKDMTDSTQAPTTVSDIGVVMFTVADQDAALPFYTEKLGYEVRADVRFGENDAMRWLEVAPPGSRARVSLNPPMGGEPGGGSIGVETPDLLGEHARLTDLGGIDVDPELMDAPGAPRMFSLRDPDGNHIWVVETPADQ